MMFALVAAFLYPQPHGNRTYLVDLPQVNHAVAVPGANRFDAINVTIARDSSVFLNGSKIPLTTLAPGLRRYVLQGSERAIYMRVDARSKYGSTLAVLNQVRDAGIHKLVFIVEDRREIEARLKASQ